MVNLRKSFSENPLPWAVQAVGLLVVIANVWIALKLAPVAQDLQSIAGRVTALESFSTKSDPLLTDYLVTKNKLENMGTDVADIKQDVRDIKSFLNVR